MPLTFEQFQDLVADTLGDHYAFKFDDHSPYAYEFNSVEGGIFGSLDYNNEWSVSNKAGYGGLGDSLENALEALENWHIKL
jgi:hypothetical protein